MTTNRRTFLRSSTATIALPFLESFGFKRFASAASAKAVAAPKRMIFLGMGFGVNAHTWYPEITDTGANYTLPDSLKTLKNNREDFSIIQHLEHAHSRDGHSGSTFWLTGADRYAIPGQSFHNSISVDQVAAEQLGKETRFTSIHVDGDDLQGHGPGSISWNKQGKPIQGLPNPAAMYHRLFSESSLSLAERQAMLLDDRSALDSVLSDARSMKRNLTKTDADKLDEYFDAIRDIETRIAKEESWLNVPMKQSKRKLREPNESMEGKDAIEIVYDLMVAAMEIDASRVFTYRLPGDSFCSSIGSSYTAHNLTHPKGPETMRDATLRDQQHAKLIGGFIDKLKKTKDADGTSLFDNSTLTFGSNLRLTHSLNNCPTIVAGGGAGFKHGRHIVVKEKKTPLCNLWLSTLKGSGIDVESFGDSNGLVDELFS